MSADVEKIIAQLWQPADEGQEPQVFAVLDAARDESIYARLIAASVECASLFRGEKAREMALVAPYLVTLKRDDLFMLWIIRNGWYDNWGIFMQSPAEFAALKRHLRSLLQVLDEEGNSLFFRYYDPRVLRVYLPTCNSQELKLFFGPVTSFYLADADKKNTLLCYRLVDDELLTEKKILSMENLMREGAI